MNVRIFTNQERTHPTHTIQHTKNNTNQTHLQPSDSCWEFGKKSLSVFVSVSAAAAEAGCVYLQTVNVSCSWL